MKPFIGGCLPLETGKTPFFHENALLYNSGRNALRAVLRRLKIERLYVPALTCPVVFDAVGAENVTPVFYDLNEDLSPAGDIPDDAVLLMNARFGTTDAVVEKVVAAHPRAIVDAAQAFFAPKRGLATVYSPRKFFGLPDGGAVVCDFLTPDDAPAERDFSYDRMAHLLAAADIGSEKADDDFIKNEESLNGFPVMRMSRLTESLLGDIDYGFVRRRRLDNFAVLHDALASFNLLKISMTARDVPMFYPFMTDKPFAVRKKLLKAGVDTPIYWPDIEKTTGKAPYSVHLRDKIVPVPLDQRYDSSDMARIVNAILN